MTMKLRIFSLSAFIISAIALSFLLMFTEIRSQVPILEKTQKVTQDVLLTFPLVKTIDAIQVDVIQVQQWLSDISATRGSDGLDEGYVEAKKSADKFKVDIARAIDLANKLGLSAIVQSLNEASTKFGPYYNTGKNMAKSYIEEGPAGGNKMMASFDAVAEEIGHAMDALVKSVDDYSSKKLKALSGQNRELINDNKKIETNIVLIMAVVFLLVAASAAYLFISMKSSFDRLLGDFDMVMSKDQTTPLRTNPEGKDEFSNLARALVTFRKLLAEFDIMAEREKVAAKTAKETRRAAMKKMAESFEASVGSIVETVSTASDTLQITAQNMSGISEQTNQQVEQASAASDQTSGNVQSVATATEEMTSTIGEISQQVAHASNASKQAVEEVGNTSQQMVELAQTANKIGEVVEIISGIAEQTNLLALNATIESARAGEAGKGFAVVANEVKQLASQTAKATGEISQQISDIQNATKRASGTMENVAGAIRRVDEISTSIAAAMEEQSAATQEIAAGVNQAAVGAQQVSDNISNVSNVSHEASAASREVMSAAGNLGEQSDLLRNEVNRFISQVRAG